MTAQHSQHHPLGAAAIEFLEQRGLSPDIVARFGIYTARRNADGEAEPHEKGSIVVFPIVDRGVVVQEKFRAPGKKFWQRAGGKRTFWNADALDDPALESGIQPLVITEGEIDALSAIECGFPLSVSVPDGAPGVQPGEQPEDVPPIDPEAEHTGKFEFMWNNRERLKRIKRFVIATDSDPPGKRLAAELVRRLSAARCSFVTYPDGCKDLNDVLMQHGRAAAAAVLQAAKPYPVSGLYRLNDYPDAVPLETFSTGWETLDQHLRLYRGEFMVVTGIPAHGKSTFTMGMLVNMAQLHGWRSAVFSPEMPVVPFMRDKLRRIISAHARPGPEHDKFINDYFVWIDDPHGKDDQEFVLDWIIEKATDAVLRDGISALLIDPWNEIEHARAKGENQSDYVGRAIRALKRFARRYEVAVIVVAHPTKEVSKGEGGKLRAPTLYDIESSAHWFNKCDHGLVVHRDEERANVTGIRVAKARFQESGERGDVYLRYDRWTGRFETLGADPGSE